MWAEAAAVTAAHHNTSVSMYVVHSLISARRACGGGASATAHCIVCRSSDCDPLQRRSAQPHEEARKHDSHHHTPHHLSSSPLPRYPCGWRVDPLHTMALVPLSAMPSQHPMRAGVLAQLLSSTLRGDSDSEDYSSDRERALTPHQSQQPQHQHSPPASHSRLQSSTHCLTSPRRRHPHLSPHHPSSATLRCRAPGCMQKQCADGVGGLCIAHAILHLPVQRASSADAPHTLAAYQRKLRRQPKQPHVDSHQHADTASRTLPTHRQPYSSRPSTAASSTSALTARSRSYQSYRRYNEYDGGSKHDETNDQTTAKLPEFTHRPPTVADLRHEGLHAFTAMHSDAGKRSKSNSRNNSRRNTATRVFSATAPTSSSSPAMEQSVGETASLSSTMLFHPRRTPAGLTLERSHTAADAVRLLRLSAHSRPIASMSSSAYATGTIRATTISALDSCSTFPLTASFHDTITSIDPLTARPPSVLLSATTTANNVSSLLLVAPAKHMKVLSAVEEQRLYRADLLARLMQRPPVARLQPALLDRMQRLFSYRPAYVTLCSRQVVRSHGEHEAIVASWRDRRRRLTGWLAGRCELSELYRRRAMWHECDSVRSRTGRLDEWMAGRLARHLARQESAVQGRSQQTKQDERMRRWQLSALSADEDVDSRAVDESQLSIVVLEPSPRSAMAGKQSAKGSPQQRVPQLALPQLIA